MKNKLFGMLEWISLNERWWSRKWLFLPLMLLAVKAMANPYIYTPFTKGYQTNLSEGALFDSHFASPMTATNLAVFYHPLSSGSIVPSWLQPYLPPESWAIVCGGGAGNGSSQAGCGPGLNMLDSVRGYASNLLELSSNPVWQEAGRQIAPGNGPLNLFVSYQPTSKLITNGQFGKNPMKFTNHYFIGVGYAF